MFTIDRILLPVAFSDNCRGTARHAAALACRFKSQLTLLHVLEPLGDALEFATGLEQMQTARRAWFDRELERFFREQLYGVPVRKVLLEGDPAAEIAAFAHAEHIDLITMASRGHGQFRRFLLGSVTAKVLHDAKCPVWTGVHMEMGLIPESISFGRIACAVGLDGQTEAVAAWASGLAAAWSAKLYVLHNVPVCAANGKAVRERLLERLPMLPPGVEIDVQPDDSPHGICKAVERVKPDLLVIGRGHGAGGAGRLPSTAYAILRAAPCPAVSI